VEDRTTGAAEQLWQTLSPEQKQAVEAVAVDMWEPFTHYEPRRIKSQGDHSIALGDENHRSKSTQS